MTEQEDLEKANLEIAVRLWAVQLSSYGASVDRFVAELDRYYDEHDSLKEALAHEACRQAQKVAAWWAAKHIPRLHAVGVQLAQGPWVEASRFGPDVYQVSVTIPKELGGERESVTVEIEDDRIVTCPSHPSLEWRDSLREWASDFEKYGVSPDWFEGPQTYREVLETLDSAAETVTRVLRNEVVPFFSGCRVLEGGSWRIRYNKYSEFVIEVVCPDEDSGSLVYRTQGRLRGEDGCLVASAGGEWVREENREPMVAGPNPTG